MAVGSDLDMEDEWTAYWRRRNLMMISPTVATELRTRAIDALQLHNGDVPRATAMMSHLVSRRAYLLDAVVADYLARVREQETFNEKALRDAGRL